MHVGFELSAVLGANRKLGDSWKMLSWQISGRMGGARGNGKRHGANGHGASASGGNGHAPAGSTRPPVPDSSGQENPFRIL